jgi:MFS family permease
MLNTGFMNNGLHSIVQGLYELPKQLRWSYLPPLMVYLAAGVSGLTAIVGTFFIKDYLNLSAAFLASLGFWAGLPWALKMPLGHLVDLIWEHKAYLVSLGAAVIAASLLIMFGLIGHTEFMASIMPVEAWFVTSVILGPVGYVIQDVVADAMTVEAVPEQDENGDDIDPDQLKIMHTTMQTLGRFAIIGGTVLVSLANVILFSDVDNLDSTARIYLYANIYLYALIIPAISIAGVILARLQHSYHNARIRKLNHTPISAHQRPEINWSILLGSLVFVVFSLSVGTSGIGYAQEIVFAGSVGIILFLMKRLIRFLQPEKRLMIVGTAIIIFTFRAMPSPGPGLTWFEIDQLLFNEQFLSILSLIASILTLVGIILLRPFMANNSIARIIVILSIAGTVLFLPSIGMYYGLHEWTAAYSGGIVDAKFIAIINTAVESPLGQVSMIPLLAWIARNAPAHMKATFFAVFASFTNLALSASALGTKYLNEAFVVTREVKDKISDAIVTTADYSELGMLLITVLLITLVMPIGMVVIIQNSRFKTID